MGPIKSAMSEHYNNNGVFPASNADAGLLPPNAYSGNYVISMSVTGDTVSILYGNNANMSINGEVVNLIASDNLGSLEWTCASGGVISDTYLPVICR